MGMLFKLVFGMLGLLWLGFMAAQALRSARRLNGRIAQFKTEQEEMAEQGRVPHPYMVLAQSGEERNEEDNVKRRKKR